MTRLSISGLVLVIVAMKTAAAGFLSRSMMKSNLPNLFNTPGMMISSHARRMLAQRRLQDDTATAVQISHEYSAHTARGFVSWQYYAEISPTTVVIDTDSEPSLQDWRITCVPRDKSAILYIVTQDVDTATLHYIKPNMLLAFGVNVFDVHPAFHARTLGSCATFISMESPVVRVLSAGFVAGSTGAFTFEVAPVETLKMFSDLSWNFTWDPTVNGDTPVTIPATTAVNTTPKSRILQTGLSCAPKWTLEGGRCYRFHTDTTTWRGARDACAAYGPGHTLAAVTSAASALYVVRNRAGQTKDFWIGATNNPAREPGANNSSPTSRTRGWVWTGNYSTAYLFAPEGQLLWRSGDPVKDNCGFLFFGCGATDVVYVDATTPGQLRVDQASDSKAYLCEGPPILPTPSPSKTASVSPSASRSATISSSKTISSTISPSQSMTATVSSSQHPTSSQTASGTASLSGTRTSSATGTGSPSFGASLSVTPSSSETASGTASETSSSSSSATGSSSHTASSTLAPSASETATSSSDSTASRTTSPAATSTASVSASPSTSTSGIPIICPTGWVPAPDVGPLYCSQTLRMPFKLASTREATAQCALLGGTLRSFESPAGGASVIVCLGQFGQVAGVGGGAGATNACEDEEDEDDNGDEDEDGDDKIIRRRLPINYDERKRRARTRTIDLLRLSHDGWGGAISSGVKKITGLSGVQVNTSVEAVLTCEDCFAYLDVAFSASLTFCAKAWLIKIGDCSDIGNGLWVRARASVSGSAAAAAAFRMEVSASLSAEITTDKVKLLPTIRLPHIVLPIFVIPLTIRPELDLYGQATLTVQVAGSVGVFLGVALQGSASVNARANIGIGDNDGRPPFRVDVTRDLRIRAVPGYMRGDFRVGTNLTLTAMPTVTLVLLNRIKFAHEFEVKQNFKLLKPRSLRALQQAGNATESLGDVYEAHSEVGIGGTAEVEEGTTFDSFGAFFTQVMENDTMVQALQAENITASATTALASAPITVPDPNPTAPESCDSCTGSAATLSEGEGITVSGLASANMSVQDWMAPALATPTPAACLPSTKNETAASSSSELDAIITPVLYAAAGWGGLLSLVLFVVALHDLCCRRNAPCLFRDWRKQTTTSIDKLHTHAKVAELQHGEIDLQNPMQLLHFASGDVTKPPQRRVRPSLGDNKFRFQALPINTVTRNSLRK